MGDAESPGEATDAACEILGERPTAHGIGVFFFQAEDGIRDYKVTGVQTCALPISVAIRAPNRKKSISLGHVWMKAGRPESKSRSLLLMAPLNCCGLLSERITR